MLYREKNAFIQIPKLNYVAAVVILITVAYILLGLSSLLSASIFSHSYELVEKQFAYSAAGLFLFWLMPYVNVREFRNPSIVKWAGIIVCAMQLLPPVLGQTLNGASRWMFGFQPSDLLTIYMIIYVYYICGPDLIDKCSSVKGTLLYVILPVFFIFASIAYLQTNLSTAITQAVSFSMMIFVGGIKPDRRVIFSVLILGLLSLVFLISLENYRMARLVNWWKYDFDITLSPEPEDKNVGKQGVLPFKDWNQSFKDYITNDGQPFYAKLSIISGGFTGKGPAGDRVNSSSRLAVSETDYIFSVLCSEYGFAVIFMFLCITAFFLHKGLNLRSETKKYVIGKYSDGHEMVESLEKDIDHNLLASGAVIVIAVQSLIHIWVNLSLMPSTGIPLPLISNGGSSKISTLVILGLLLNACCGCKAERPSLNKTIKQAFLFLLAAAVLYVLIAFVIYFFRDFYLQN